MPYVHVDMDDIDDDDLVGELKSRGYIVVPSQKELYADVIWHFRNNRIKEAMIALERIEPELMGISDKAICVTKHRNLVKALEEILKEITPGVSGYYIFERIVKEALNEYR